MDTEFGIGVAGVAIGYAIYRYFKKYKLTHLSGLAKILKSEKVSDADYWDYSNDDLGQRELPSYEEVYEK
jgi:hypothetical protein